MMKKISSLLLCLFICGCATSVPVTQETAVPSAPASFESGNYDSYFQNKPMPNSYTASVRSDYEMIYPDASKEMYHMDAVLEAQDLQTSPIAHVAENLDSNGMFIKMEGYFYGDRLYNNYNNVTYYDPMNFAQLKESLLVPMDPYHFNQEEVNQIIETANADYVQYEIQLRKEEATKLFLTHYDFADLEQYSSFSITDSKIIQQFNTKGHCIKEDAEFHGTLAVQGMDVEVVYHSVVDYVDIDATVVEISENQKQEHLSYVSYEQIDTNAISDYDIHSDEAEDTIEKTFRKRLVNRLKYEETSEGVYKTSYNDNESYIIDFNNHQFTYTNYSNRYVYNWLGDTGSFGTTCNYDYETKAQSEGCVASTMEMLENVKMYLRMELYYCGLSLEDLIAEEK